MARKQRREREPESSDEEIRRHDSESSEDEQPRKRRHEKSRKVEKRKNEPPPKPRKVPTKISRGCTDIIFLILFILVLAIWGLIAFVTFTQVDVQKIISPKNAAGEVCGSEGISPLWYTENFVKCGSIKFPPDLECKGSKNFCVKKCPSKSIEYTKVENLTDVVWEEIVCETEARNAVLKGKDDSERFKLLKDEIEKKTCLDSVIASQKIFVICFPKPEDEGLEISSDLKDMAKNAQVIFKIIIDIYNSFFHILGGLGVALVLSLIWMILMRFFAGIIVWVTTVLCPIIFGGLTAFTSYRAYTLYQKRDETESFDTDHIFDISYLDSRYEFYIAVAAVVGILFLITSFILLFLRKRIAIAVALIKQASRSIASLPTLIAFPVFPYVLQVLAIGITLAIFFMVATLRAEISKGAGDVIQRNCESLDISDIGVDTANATQKVCEFFVGFLSSGIYIYIYNFFAGLWMMFFVSAFSFMVVSHAVARYFWTRREKSTKFMAVGSSVGTTIRYHLGTIAFGSLIVAIVSLIRRALAFIQQKTNRTNPNAFLKFLIKCCICCFWFMEKFLKYINKNAYIMVALYGKNFCRSAAKAFSLIVSNALRALVVTKVTDFIIFIAKVVTTAGACIIFYFVMQNKSAKEFLKVPAMYSIFIPIAALAVGSYIVTSCFFDVYRDAVDTLFICFLEDKKINDGSRERPYQMPSELLKILNKKNYNKKGRKD